MDVITGRHDSLFTVNKGSKVHVARIRSEESRAVLIINFNEKAEEVTLHGSGNKTEFVNLLTGKIVKARDQVKLVIPENTAYVYKCQGESE